MYELKIERLFIGKFNLFGFDVFLEADFVLNFEMESREVFCKRASSIEQLWALFPSEKTYKKISIDSEQIDLIIISKIQDLVDAGCVDEDIRSARKDGLK